MWQTIIHIVVPVLGARDRLHRQDPQRHRPAGRFGTPPVLNRPPDRLRGPSRRSPGWHTGCPPGAPTRPPCPPRSATPISSTASPPRCSTSATTTRPTTSRHLAARLRARAGPGRQGRDRADPHQLEDVRRGAPADLPGHRHRQRVPEDRHGRPLRGLPRQRRGRGQRRRPQGLPRTRTTRCAPRSSATRTSSAGTPATTRRRWCR